MTSMEKKFNQELFWSVELCCLKDGITLIYNFSKHEKKDKAKLENLDNHYWIQYYGNIKEGGWFRGEFNEGVALARGRSIKMGIPQLGQKMPATPKAARLKGVADSKEMKV